MTNLDDFDRSLGAFLADGPTIAPEAPLVAALAHARTTPRRWDPLGALRPDVMGRRTSRAGFRPALVLATVALVAAAIGVAVVGSRPQETTPTPPPSVPPEASLTPSAAFRSDVNMLLAGGGPLVVTVADTTGDLRAATSLMPAEGASVEIGAVAIVGDPSDPAALLVTWSDITCQRRAELIVDEPSHRILISADACDGDSVANDRILRLTFAGPVVDSLWTGASTTIAASGDPGSSPEATLPPATEVTLGTVDGEPVLADVHDLSGHLTGISVSVNDRTAPVEFITASNGRPDDIVLAWPGAACPTFHRVTIAADFGMTVERSVCAPAVPETLVWAIRLSFDRSVNADAVDTALKDAARSDDFPAFVVVGADTGGSPYRIAIYDPSGSILIPAPLAPAVAADPGAGAAAISQAGGSIIRLTWRHAPCATEPVLRLDATGTSWTLEEPSCTPVAPEVVRSIELKLANPLSVEAVTLTTQTPPP